MTNYDIDDFSQNFGFGSFSGEVVDYSKPYIPEAIDCQSCGYCLKVCPTYKVRPEESYSPRGRVRMIERVVRKNDVLKDDELAALNACTLCRSCETVCPSKMDYAGLYQQTMETHETRPKQGPAIKSLHYIFSKGHSAQHVLTALLRVYRYSGLQRLFQWLPVSLLKGDFKHLEALLPVPFEAITIPDHNPARTVERQGEVALFTGCVGNILDTQTHNATVKVLTSLGYDVCILQNQTCCGATYAHNGDLERAKVCAQTNINAFSGSRVASIIYNSSGCGAFLSEYDALLNEGDQGGDPEQRLPVIDIIDFLLENGRIGALSFAKLGQKVAVHEPCSHRNVLKTQDAIYKVLDQIPGLEVVPLADNSMCCGAGGTKMVTQPELASPLRDEKVKALIDSEADILLSTNLSCVLHLASGVREAGYKIEVLHPARLLAQQLIETP